MSESIDSMLITRLDTLIKLQALSMIGGYESQKERIDFLAKVGMKPKEIAELLGTTANTVSVALAKMRAAERKKSAATAKSESGDGGDGN